MRMCGHYVVCLLLRQTEFWQDWLLEGNLLNIAKVDIGHIC